MAEVEIKALKWRARPDSDSYADCEIGRYEVDKIGGRWVVILRHVSGNNAEDERVASGVSEIDAKEQAEQDREARIRSALVPATPMQNLHDAPVEVKPVVNHTPGEWRVRIIYEDAEGRAVTEPTGTIRDCFVVAPDVNGFAYNAEILGEDEYREQSGGIARKLADCQLIANAPKLNTALIAERARAEKAERERDAANYELATRDDAAWEQLTRRAEAAEADKARLREALDDCIGRFVAAFPAAENYEPIKRARTALSETSP